MRIELERLAAQTEAIEELERALVRASEGGFPEPFQAQGKGPALFPESFEAQGKAVPNGSPRA